MSYEFRTAYRRFEWDDRKGIILREAYLEVPADDEKVDILPTIDFTRLLDRCIDIMESTMTL